MSEYKGVPMDPHMFDHLIGYSRGSLNMHYTWRDVALYALSVGAHLEDTKYFYERVEGGMKALPTFTILPYLDNITMDTITPEPEGTNEVVRNFLEEKLGYMPNGLHMAMDVKIDGEIDPYCSVFVVKDHLNNVLDRGEGKGIVSDCAMDIWDIAGRHVSTLHSYHFNDAFGGFGGEKFKALKLDYPDRAPDYETTELLSETQAALYRLCGDTYKVHVDVKYAQSCGYEKPFMMGMATYGFGVRMAIQQVIPYQPERVRHISAQVRSLCFPGQHVTLQTWKMEEGTLYFKLIGEDGKLLLGNGLLEYV